MFEDIKELGLTDNEARIYLYLLDHGTHNPARVAQQLGLHRGYVYDTLERMREKQIVSSVHIAGKLHFKASRPQNLAQLLKDRYQTFQAIVPALAARSASEPDVCVEVHQGERAYRTLLRDVATHASGEVLIIGLDEDVVASFEPIYVAQYLAALDERHLSERVIVRKGSKHIAHPRIEYRELEEEYIGRLVQLVYGSRVAIFAPGNPHTLTIFNAEIVADTYRRQFELLWRTANE